MIQVVCGWKFHSDTVKMWQMELYWRPPDLEMDLRNISLRKLAAKIRLDDKEQSLAKYIISPKPNTKIKVWQGKER